MKTKAIVNNLIKYCLISTVLFLNACATSYQSGESIFSISGGHHTVDVTQKMKKIIFFGNGYTNINMTKKYVLFRAAEYANEQNKPYFILYPSLLDASMEKSSLEPSAYFVLGFPSAFAFVVVLDEKQDNAYETKKIISELEEFKKIQKNSAVKTGK